MPAARVPSARRARFHEQVSVRAGRFPRTITATQLAAGDDAHVLRPDADHAVAVRQQIHRAFTQKARDRDRAWRVVDRVRLARNLRSARRSAPPVRRRRPSLRHDRASRTRSARQTVPARPALRREPSVAATDRDGRAVRPSTAPGIRKQRPRHRGALAFAAGKLARPASEQRAAT